MTICFQDSSSSSVCRHTPRETCYLGFIKPQEDLSEDLSQTICFPFRGSAVCVPGMHKLTMEPGHSGTTLELDLPGKGRTVGGKNSTFTAGFMADGVIFWGVIIELKYHLKTQFFTFCKIVLLKSLTISSIIGYF